MSESRFTEEDIFSKAIEIEDHERRRIYLEDACGEDRALRAAVDGLLAMHDTAGEFLETPALEASSLRLTEQPGTTIGHYRLLERIGEGGFGVVWRAEQLEPVRREVALKITKPGLDTARIIARFESERQALAMMNHPNIAMVLDAGSLGDDDLEERLGTETRIAGTDRGALDFESVVRRRPYFVMELVDGPALDRYCAWQQLNLRKRLELFLQVCRAVQHAHQKGIIHRDLKPSNVLVATDDERPVPKVIDFGIAKALTGAKVDPRPGEGVTIGSAERQQIAGTLEYMSPEQLRPDADVDTQSDVYALGGILYRLLTGSTPFGLPSKHSATRHDLARMICEQLPERASQRLQRLITNSEIGDSPPGVTPKALRNDLDWILAKSLAKDPADRYATANGLARDVERYLEGLAVSAAPQRLSYHMRTLVRRHRSLAATVLLVAVTLVVGTVSASIGFVRAERGQREARQQWRRAEAERRNAELASKKSEVQRQRAVREASKARQVVSVLQQLIGATHREEAHPADYTLREALDEFSDSFQNELDGQPEVEATLRRAIGRSYLSIGQAQRAGPHLERALALRQQVLRPDDLAIAESRVDYAHYLVRCARLAEAEKLIKLARARLEKEPPSDALFWAVNLQIRVCRDRNQFLRTRELADQMCDISERVYEPGHPLRVLTRAYAATLRPPSQLGEGKAREALDALQNAPVSNPADVALAQRYLAMILLNRGQAAEAVALARKAVASDRKMFGEFSIVLVNSTLTLVRALREAGHVDEAVVTARQAVDLVRQATHKRSLRRDSAYLQLALSLERDEPAEAADVYAQAIAVRQEIVGQDLPLAQRYRSRGQVLARLGQWSAAASSFGQAAAIARKVASPPQFLAHTLFMQAQAEREAEPNGMQGIKKSCALLDEALSSYSKMDSLQILARLDLVADLLRLGRREEAQQRIDRWFGQLPSSANPAVLAGAKLGRAQVAQASGDLKLAEKLARDAVARIKVRKYPRIAVHAQMILASSLIEQHQYVQAEMVLLATARRADRRGGRSLADKYRVICRLIALYEAWEKPDKAQQWRRFLTAGKPRPGPTPPDA